MCGFIIDEFVLEEVLEHVRHHRSVPWRAWWRDPRRAWQATFGTKAGADLLRK